MSHKIIPFLVDYIVKHIGSISRNARVACIAMREYQESVATGQTHGRTY